MLRNETGAFCAFVIGRWRLRCLSVGGIGVWRWRRGEEFAVFGRGFVEGCYGGRGCIRYGFGFTSWGWIWEGRGRWGMEIGLDWWGCEWVSECVWFWTRLLDYGSCEDGKKPWYGVCRFQRGDFGSDDEGIIDEWWGLWRENNGMILVLSILYIFWAGNVVRGMRDLGRRTGSSFEEVVDAIYMHASASNI